MIYDGVAYSNFVLYIYDKPTEITNGITLHDELQLSTKRETLAQLKRQINAVGNNSRLLARGYFAVFAQ